MNDISPINNAELVSHTVDFFAKKLTGCDETNVKKFKEVLASKIDAAITHGADVFTLHVEKQPNGLIKEALIASDLIEKGDFGHHYAVELSLNAGTVTRMPKYGKSESIYPPNEQKKDISWEKRFEESRLVPLSVYNGRNCRE